MARATPLSTAPRRHASVKRAAAVAAVALAGCGGGFFFAVGDDDFDDSFPSVSLAASPTSAPPGATVQLVAAASDPSGIDHVAFYQFDVGSGGTATLLGADGSAPFEWNAVVPVRAASVSYFARATDAFGVQADSAVVTVAIVP
jgi:hypothetical protein